MPSASVRKKPANARFKRAEAADDLASRLDPLVAGWFGRTYAAFTQAQLLCIPAILAGKSVLLSSPTGSGKTLAGFLGIIDHLVRQPPPEGGIFAIYISPLRALTYDIQKNLSAPLSAMGLEERIRVGSRTGDTTAAERARFRRRPPHLLLTTPESLSILVCQPRYREALSACRFVIVDELHALAENKRGAHLSVSLERLERLRPPGAPALCRVGLSATVSPLETMAGFLAGAGRPCLIAEAKMERRAVIEVFSPVRRHPYPPAGYNAGRVMRELAALVRSRRSVLLFTNTRSGAELTAMNLKTALPELADRIEVHHSSLDRSVRLEVEDRLKNGELRAVVCSTSLEMGVDIGAIDLVVLISSPKGISRTLQRIGRSGHSIAQTSHGILVATNVVDLLECAVTARMARERHLDSVKIHENAGDVLAQHLVGCAMAEPGMPVEEAWELVRRAWPFQRLERAQFNRVLEYLEGGGRCLAQAYSETFGKIAVREGRLFTASPRVERESLVNMGTITSAGLVDVMLKRRRLGAVEEYFIKNLRPGDVFVLAGRSVRLIETGWLAAKVEDAGNERPNVPTWGHGRMPLSRVLAAEISRVRAGLDDRLEDGSPAALDWLVEQWEMSLANAQAVIAQFSLQRRHSQVPREGRMLIELYREPGEDGRSHYFFHSLAGRAGNEALARIVAQRLATLAGGNALVTSDDYGFLLTVQPFQELPLEDWRACFEPAGAEEDLRRSLRKGEMVQWMFGSIAQTGLMTPRQLPGKQRALRQLRFSSEMLFRVLEEHEPDHPMLLEAYRQAMEHFLDFDVASAWMEQALGWEWVLRESDKVSPFAFGMFASRFREGIMFENPAEAIERMYHRFYGGEAG
jgi:ATP-dependent Lhr-like helicase